MADVTKLKELLEAYATAMRAGVITPCLEDENEFRKRMGLLATPQVVIDAWTSQGGTRAPVTLQRPKDIEGKSETEESKK